MCFCLVSEKTLHCTISLRRGTAFLKHFESKFLDLNFVPKTCSKDAVRFYLVGWLNNFLKVARCLCLIKCFTIFHFNWNFWKFNNFLAFRYFFFLPEIFFPEHSRIKGLQGRGEGICLTPHYHFHPLHRHIDISRPITAASSSLHIASSRTWTGNLSFPSARR